MTVAYDNGPTRRAAAGFFSVSSGRSSAAVVFSSPLARGSFAVPRNQLYYFTREWQENERIAAEEIARGDVRSFDSSDDAIRWLLSTED